MKHKKSLLIVCYVLSAAGICAYLLFPETEIRRFLVYHARSELPALDLSIDHIRPAFPPGLRLSGVTLTYGELPPAQIDRITVRPRLVSLLRSEKTINLSAKAYAGSIQSRLQLRLSSAVHPTRLQVRVKSVAIERLPLPKTLAERDITGRLDGELVYDSSAQKKKAVAKLQITQGAVKIQSPILPVQKLVYDLLEADIAVEQESIRIEHCEVKGDQVNANVSGRIVRKEPFENSILNLKGMIVPQERFLAELNQKLPVGLLPKDRDGTVRFPIQLTGTLLEPGISFR